MPNLNHITALPTQFSALAPVLDDIARDAADGITITLDREDLTFGDFGPLASLARAATTVEGGMLENGLRAVLESDGRYTLMPPDFRVPLLDAATAAAKSNERSALSAMRLDHRAYAPEHFAPDLIAVRHDTGAAVILDLKRTTTSHGKSPLVRLEQKLIASALVLRDVLFADPRRLIVKEIEVAIVDCDSSDKRDLVIGLPDLDSLLDCPGLGACLVYLRRRYAAHIQEAFTNLLKLQRLKDMEDPNFEVESTVAADSGENTGGAPTFPNPVAISFARKRRSNGLQG